MNSENNLSKPNKSIKNVKLISLPLSIACFDCINGRFVCGLNKSYICLDENSNPNEFGCSSLKIETPESKLEFNLN